MQSDEVREQRLLDFAIVAVETRSGRLVFGNLLILARSLLGALRLR